MDFRNEKDINNEIQSWSISKDQFIAALGGFAKACEAVCNPVKIYGKSFISGEKPIHINSGQITEPGDLVIFESQGFLGKIINNYPNLENINRGLEIPWESGDEKSSDPNMNGWYWPK